MMGQSAAGLLLLDKPAGITSFTAVNRVRRLLNCKKAGHTGTLDPMATGVLPILLGSATRFGEYLPSQDKAYWAACRLGIRTDTLDITGNIVEERPVQVTRPQIEAALAQFRGRIWQVPPMVSAIKQNGVRLYALARQGIEVQREARQVEIHHLCLEECPAVLTEEDCSVSLAAECSSGTYIRSLIDDLGQVLGCGAAMTELRRTKANGCSIADCVTLEQLEQGSARVIPIDEVLSAYPAVTVTPAQAVRFRNGGALDLARLHIPGPSALYRVYGTGEFLGLGKTEADQLAVAKVIPREA